MASAKVLSATIAHVEEAKHEPVNKCEEPKKDDEASPPPPPPLPPSEQKHADPETEQGTNVAPEPETLAIGFEAKAVLADEPLSGKKVVKSSTKVAPEPTEYKAEEKAEVEPEEEPVVEDDKDEEEKPVEEEEKVSPQATVEKKEE